MIAREECAGYISSAYFMLANGEATHHIFQSLSNRAIVLVIINQSVGLGKLGGNPSLSRKGQSPGSNRRRKPHSPEMGNGVASASVLGVVLFL